MQDSVWNRLREGSRTFLGSASYVCLGWVPHTTKAGAPSVMAHLWGECRVCSKGFSTYANPEATDKGQLVRTCPEHRGQGPRWRHV